MLSVFRFQLQSFLPELLTSDEMVFFFAGAEVVYFD